MTHPFANANDPGLLWTYLNTLVIGISSRSVNDLIYKKSSTIVPRLLKPMGETVYGDGITLHDWTGSGNSTRMSRDTLRDFGVANVPGAAKVKLRFTPDTPSTNDFNEIQSVGEISHLDLVRPGDAAAAADNIAMKIRGTLTDGLGMAISRGMHANANARIAMTNSILTLNDSRVYASCTAWADGSTSARLKIDTGSIAFFNRGDIIEFRKNSDSTLLADYVKVTDANPDDGSIGIALTSRSSVATLNALESHCDDPADADIYMSTEYGTGFRSSLQAFFTEPTAGESFIGGVDRSTEGYRFMVPYNTRVGSSTAAPSMSMLDSLGLTMNLGIGAEGKTMVCFGNPSLIQSLRTDIGDNAYVTESPERAGNYNFGNMGVTFMHPTFGRMALISDPMSIPTMLYVVSPETWEMYHAGFPNFQWLTNETGGIWERRDSTTPGAGRSKFYRAEGYENLAVICRKAPENASIQALSA